MKKWEKEILQKQISDEQKVIYRLKDSYKFALDGVKEKIQVLQSREQTQSVIYQLTYQKNLQKQLEDIYSKMGQKWYSDIDTYLNECYEDSFYSTMYGLHQDGIPVVIPFNQAEMAQMAAQSDYQGIQLSQKLYTDSVGMAAVARQEITRGIAMNSSYADIARVVEKRGEANLNQAYRIVRTESHRVNNEVKMKTITKAQENGADVVKQWDSTIDRRTRPTHTELDGQLREIDQPFKIPSTGQTAMFPGGFGIAKEDINCRCVMLQRARWALDKSLLEKNVGNLDGMSNDQMQNLADKFGISVDELIKKSNGIIENDGSINHSINAKNYNDFKKKYQKKAETETAKYQAQLDVLTQEKDAILSKYGSEEALKKQAENYALFGTGSYESWEDFQKLQDYEIKIPDLQTKLGITQKVEPLKPTPQPSSDFETLKKNAVKFDNGYDADKYHTQKNFVQSRWDNDLTENERKGIRTYTSSAYSDMNSHLRNNDLEGSRYKKEIIDATKGLEKTLIAEDTVVYLGMTGGASDFAKWTGIPLNQLSDKSVQDSLIGTRLVEKGFMSTGSNAGSAWSGLKLEVYLPKGSQAMYVDPISHYRGEYEILVQRNSTFEIEEIVTNPSNNYIERVVLRLVEQSH